WSPTTHRGVCVWSGSELRDPGPENDHSSRPTRFVVTVRGRASHLQRRRWVILLCVMALPATMRRFTIALSDVDRNVYEQLDWRVAQHPSESPRYLVARVLARSLEHAEGLEFSKGGVSDDEEPALVQRDLRGDLVAWIEIGSPTPDRLHKAAKAAPRVAVYMWKDPERLVAAIAERGVHRAEDLE